MSSRKDHLSNRPSDYRLLCLIGRGSDYPGSVYAAHHAPSQSLVAVKLVPLDALDGSSLSQLQNEIQMSRAFAHINLLPLLAAFVQEDQLWLILPYMAFGSCQDMIRAGPFTRGLPESAVVLILRDVLQGLVYLHSRGIVHRNIQSSHILLGADGRVCLAGFALCCSLMRNGLRLRRLHEFPVSSAVLWHSPELLRQDLQGYDNRSDLYMLGICACELATGSVPFARLPLTEMALCKWEGDPINFEAAGMSPALHDFVNVCVRSDPKQRLTAEELLSLPLFRKPRSTLRDSLAPLEPVLEFEGAMEHPHQHGHDACDEERAVAWDL